jgi:hypothetical protein
LFFLDLLNGGAWPLLVGGVICLVDSVNGRDPSCPVGDKIVKGRQLGGAASGRFSSPEGSKPSGPANLFGGSLLCRIPDFASGEILGNSRSVMLLNALGDTRTTMSVRTRNPTHVGPT